jgi:hypothetical protein
MIETDAASAPLDRTILRRAEAGVVSVSSSSTLTSPEIAMSNSDPIRARNGTDAYLQRTETGDVATGIAGLKAW